MYCSYVLRIDTDPMHFETLNDLFDLKKNQDPKGYWEYEIDENDRSFNNAINTITDKIEKNSKHLAKYGISSDNMAIWIFYEYEEQCNLEFAPFELKRLSENNLSLCISCWENPNLK